MNREIKFRGFSEILNRFVYGFFQEVEAEGIGYSYIFWQGHVTPVRADSVAQFTGIYTADYKEIYEGDILSYGKSTNRNVVVYENGAFTIWGEPFGWDFDSEDKPVICDQKYCNILGNSFQNPELLIDSNQTAL